MSPLLGGHFAEVENPPWWVVLPIIGKEKTPATHMAVGQKQETTMENEQNRLPVRSTYQDHPGSG